MSFPNLLRQECLPGLYRLLSRHATSRRKVGNNTWLQTERTHESYVELVLHTTPILKQYPDGEVHVFTGGYRTNITKNRLNLWLKRSGAGGNWDIIQNRRTWYWHNPITKVHVRFYDGDRIRSGRLVLPDPRNLVLSAEALLTQTPDYLRGTDSTIRAVCPEVWRIIQANSPLSDRALKLRYAVPRAPALAPTPPVLTAVLAEPDQHVVVQNYDNVQPAEERTVPLTPITRQVEYDLWGCPIETNATNELLRH